MTIDITNSNNLIYPECTQAPKDRQLLVAVGVIVLVEVCFSVPLLTMAILHWDFAIIIDKKNAPILNNVSYTVDTLSIAVNFGVDVMFFPRKRESWRTTMQFPVEIRYIFMPLLYLP